MSKRGFTLLELLIAILIVGILSAVGFFEFNKMVEKNRTAEAKRILGNIRIAEGTYFLTNNTYTTLMSSLPVAQDIPASCVNTHYFSYDITAASGNDFTAVATRCTGGGKSPDAPAGAGYTIILDAIGTWAGSNQLYYD